MNLKVAIILAFGLLATAPAAPRAAEMLTNGGIEELSGGQPVDWDYHRNAASGVNTDPAYAHGGNHSLKFDLSLGIDPEWDHKPFPVTPGQTCRIQWDAWTTEVISSGGLDVYVRWWQDQNRTDLVGQDLVCAGIGKQITQGWEHFSRIVTAPAGCAGGEVLIYSVASGPAGKVYMDDFSFQELKLARVTEPRPFSTIFPKAAKPPAAHLYTYDNTGKSRDIMTLVSTLQGVVNRKEPRIYCFNAQYDREWLAWMQEKGYTQSPTTVPSWVNLVDLFKGELAGKVIYDPALPGSIHAAVMIAAVRGGIAMAPAQASLISLPVLEDLRGRWTKNVDAYKYVYNTYWSQMNHHILASVHPLTNAAYVRDYLTANKVFTFWLSGEDDGEAGQSPTEERAFIDQIFAATPANIPVWGWFGYGSDKGISEYEGMSWASRYGKFLSGTEFSSNLSVHSGITVNPDVFRQKQVGAMPKLTLDPGKVYVCFNILDSGDAQWYWQSYQRQVWEDSLRGQVPIGYAMTPTVLDTIPDVMQWYYEKATPMDYLFGAVSGTGYMFTTHYGEVFEDADAAWNEFIDSTSDYYKKLDLNMLTTYDGGWGELTPPSTRIWGFYTRGIAGLRGMFPDLGRHEGITPDTADYLFDEIPVFHTLTRYAPPESNPTTQQQIEWQKNQILSYAPTRRPGFMNCWMSSWQMFPSAIKQLADSLPAQFVPVTPPQMLDLYEQSLKGRNWAQNGDFETGALDQWSYWKRGSAAGNATIMAGDRTGQGHSACRLTRTSTGDFQNEDLVLISTNDPLRPNAQVRKGRTYRLTFWAKATQQDAQPFRVNLTAYQSPDAADMMAETAAGMDFGESFTAGRQWQSYTMLAKIPATAGRRVQIQIRLANEALKGLAGDLVIDDIAFVEEPHSLARTWAEYGK